MSLTPRSALDIIWARLNEAIGDKIAAAADSADGAEKQAGKAKAEADKAKAEAERAKAEADRAGPEAAAEVDKLTAGAPEAFDTLKEISDELEKNETERAALATTIGKKADKGHKHDSSDITDASGHSDGTSGMYGRLARWDSLGALRVSRDPGHENELTRKSYVDAQVDKKTDTAYVDSAVSDKATKSEVAKKADTTYVDQELGKKSDTGHTHTIKDTSGLQTALDGKAPSNHNHSVSEVDGLEARLDKKSDYGHRHTISETSGLQAALDGKAPSKHSHSVSEVVGLGGELGKKADTTYVDQELGKKSDTGHTHSIGEIRGADEALGKKADISYVDQGLGKKSDTGHRHTTDQIDNLDELIDRKVGALNTTWQQREAVFISNEVGASDEEWNVPSLNPVGGTLPEWVRRIDYGSVRLVDGVYEVTAQAVIPPNSDATTTSPGGIILYSRDDLEWVGRSGTRDEYLNGVSMVFDTRGMTDPRIYAGCYPNHASVKINLLVRKLV